MLKYITFSGPALSVLLVLLDWNVQISGNLLKIKRETGIPIKTQLSYLIKN